MTTEAPYHASATRSRVERDGARDALDVLEEALSAPAPGREEAWRDTVVDALDALIAALDGQARSDLGRDSLLHEIGDEHPRLVPRIQRLHQEHQDLRNAAASLRAQIPTRDDDSDLDIDTADIRDRLSALGRRYRQHRARESDLVFEAVNVDLGAGD